MRRLCLTALLVLALPMFTFATVLTFGPVCSGACSTALMPAGYGGFTWDPNIYVVSNTYFMGGYGNTYGAPSGGAAFNAFGDSPVMVSSSPFYFSGADFTTWAGGDAYQGYSSVTVTIDAYDALSNHIGSVTATLSPTGYNFVTANFANVSELVFTNDCGSCSGRWWLMDNFTYNPTPEPGTLLMFGSGVLGLAGLIRRKLSI